MSDEAEQPTPDDLELALDNLRWRRGKFSDSDDFYWWRPSDDAEPEVSLVEPPDAWKLGVTDSGSQYLWRTDPNGEPDVKFWHQSHFEDTGEPFWYATDALEVRLSNPFDLEI